MTVTHYVNGVQAWQQIVASANGFLWNAGQSGPWGVGDTPGGNSANLWMHDWRVEDGVVKTAGYFNALYKKAIGINWQSNP